MAYIITCAFIALDFITGLIQAAATGTFSSSIMRQGLFHKLGLLLCIALGVLVDYAQGFLELGVAVPVAGAVCAYIVIMEIGSSLENICKINPDLMPDKLTALFGVTTEDEENG
ncbi:MAG: phage holin family protein [Clostridiales bacterium]|nr:phage holin family protein [Clostridiales bacterium]